MNRCFLFCFSCNFFCSFRSHRYIFDLCRCTGSILSRIISIWTHKISVLVLSTTEMRSSLSPCRSDKFRIRSSFSFLNKFCIKPFQGVRVAVIIKQYEHTYRVSEKETCCRRQKNKNNKKIYSLFCRLLCVCVCGIGIYAKICLFHAKLGACVWK